MDEGQLRQLEVLANSQCGLFSVGQAAALRVDPDDLYRLQKRGWLRMIRRHVYAFAGRKSRWEAEVALGLFIDTRGALSHGTAAYLHRFDHVARPDIPEATLSRQSNARIEGARVHLSGPVDEREVEVRRGVRLTSPAQTVVDLATIFNIELIEKILDWGIVNRKFTVADVIQCLNRQPHRRVGLGPIRNLVDERRNEPATHSVLEQDFTRKLAPLAPFETQYAVPGCEVDVIVDFAWPTWLSGLEADGRRYHSRSRAAFQRETRKLTALAAINWKIAHGYWGMSQSQVLEAVLSVMPVEAFPDVRRRFGIWPPRGPMPTAEPTW